MQWTFHIVDHTMYEPILLSLREEKEKNIYLVYICCSTIEIFTASAFKSSERE